MGLKSYAFQAPASYLLTVPQPAMKTQNRKTEALLLLGVQVVLLAGLALVFFGKKITTD